MIEMINYSITTVALATTNNDEDDGEREKIINPISNFRSNFDSRQLACKEFS